MAFPVPKDVRVGRDFELIKGIPELLREDVKIDDPDVESFSLGEPVKFVVAAGVRTVKKLEDAAPDNSGNGVPGAKICWTKYVPDDTWNGQADAQGTQQLTIISGVYQARTKLYTGVVTPGALLVASWDATTAGGILEGIDPTTPATAVQIQNALGRVLYEDTVNSYVYFESIG